MSLPSGFAALQEAAREGSVDRVRELLDLGVDQNTPPGMPRGWSPLMYAAWHGRKEVARLLVERGADVNRECGDGFTAITLAAKRRSWKIVELLAAHGADVTHVDANGVSALGAAERARKATLVEFLRGVGGAAGLTLPSRDARFGPDLGTAARGPVRRPDRPFPGRGLCAVFSSRGARPRPRRSVGETPDRGRSPRRCPGRPGLRTLAAGVQKPAIRWPPLRGLATRPRSVAEPSGRPTSSSTLGSRGEEAPAAATTVGARGRRGLRPASRRGPRTR